MKSSERSALDLGGTHGNPNNPKLRQSYCGSKLITSEIVHGLLKEVETHLRPVPIDAENGIEFYFVVAV